MNRGERAKVLPLKMEADVEAMHQALEELRRSPPGHPHSDLLRGCARDALARLILPSLEREVRRELTERAEAHAVTVFARNLRNLLLQAPVRDRRVLAIEPGLQERLQVAGAGPVRNRPLDHGVMYLWARMGTARRPHRKSLTWSLGTSSRFVAIGNGTACGRPKTSSAPCWPTSWPGRASAS